MSKRILLLACIVMLGLACSSAELESVESAQEPLVTYRSATNGWSNLPAASQYYCHTVRMSATGGHAHSVEYAGVPASGTVFVADNASAIAAIPHDSTSGTATIDSQCDSWSNFHGNLTYAGYVGTYTLSWPGNGMLSAVSGSIGAYYQDSVCALSRLDGLSQFSEKAEVDVTSNPGIYTLKASGFRELGAATSCAAFGRPLSGQEWITATTASSPFSSYSSANGVCLIMYVRGSLDDGKVMLIGGSQMRLEVTGTVTSAKAMCFPY